MSQKMVFDEGLRSFATVRQLEYIEAIDKHGSATKAAKSFGIHQTTVTRSLEQLKRTAAARGWAPEGDLTHPVPEPFLVKGTSTLYDENGKVRQQWVKTQLDQAAVLDMLREAIKGLAAEVKRAKPVKPPTNYLSFLCNTYTLTDSHVGMYAWFREGGADWNLEIAEDLLTRAFERLMAGAPDAEVGVVANLGDFLHFDGLTPVTPTHGHILDASGRLGQIVAVAIRILRRVIGMALKKHKRVKVLIAEGNHDIASAVWLRLLMKALFEDEPRVEIIDSELPYYAFQHGKVMLCWHHGHLKKNEQLPLLFATEYPVMWGETTKRYCDTGHRHHEELKEHSGMTVRQHTTFAARDAHAARGGWHSSRMVTCVTYHSEYGQVATNSVIPEMLLEAV